jgi:GntR family transcriptional repressor for pyruvate dehydrogenase complex
MFAAIGNPTEYLVHDVLFHRIISQASGNPILAALMETITSALYDRRRRTVEHAIDLRESAEMHREIYRAIRARKPEDARALMDRHLRMAEAAQGMERSGERKPVAANGKPAVVVKSQHRQV